VDYANIRILHITCAAISIALFASRGAMHLAGIPWRRWRWLRVVPHLNDTVLLGAAVALALGSRLYPLAQAWLTAKVVALVVYVVAGSRALRADASPRQRRLWFGLALATVGYIVMVALTRSPFGVR
jgi:uncharacterized membrane protein SirB2